MQAGRYVADQRLRDVSVGPLQIRPHSLLPLIAAAVAVGSIPAESVIVLEGFGTLTRLLILGAAAATVLDCVNLQRIRVLLPAHFAMCGYVLWTAITLLWSESSYDTAVRFGLYCQSLIFVWVIHELASSETRRAAIIGGYVAGAVLASILTIRSYAAGSALTTDSRYGTAASDPNQLSLCLIIAVPLLLHLVSRVRGLFIRALLLSGLVAILCAILLTGSRGGLAALLVTCLVTAALGLSTPRRRVMAFLFLLTLAGTAYFGRDSLPSSVARRYAEMPGEAAHGTMANRRILWSLAVDLIRERPLVGYGSGAFMAMADRRAGTHAVAHNTFLSVTAEQGLIGLALLITILVRITINIYHCGRLPFRLWLSMLSSWCIGASFLTFEATKCTWLMFGLFAAYATSESPQRVRWNTVDLRKCSVGNYAYHATRTRV